MAGDEGIWIGGHSTTDEERQQIENEYRARRGGGGTNAPEGGGYYDGEMPSAGEQPSAEPPSIPGDTNQPMEEAAPEPKPSTHWMAQPEHMAEVWNKYDQDPNYEDEHYSREQIDTLHDYMSYKNPGKPMDQWGPLMEDDDFVTREIEKNNWYDPQREEAVQQAANRNELTEIYNPEDPEKAAFFEQREMGDWNNLDWIGKLTAAVTTNDEGLLNTPEWAKKTQSAAQALSSAMAGPATLKILGGVASMAASAGIGGGATAGAAAALANPYVLAAAALAVGGLAFYQAYTGKEVPVFSKFLELSDLADTMTEHAIGYGIQAYDIGKEKMQKAIADPNDAYGFMQAVNDTIKTVGSESQSMWKAGEYTYEMYGSIGDFAIDALKEIFKGEEGTKQGEAWFFNRGINEKQQLAEGTYGTEGIATIRGMFQDMDQMGIGKDLQQSLMQQAVINASGSSGNVSDYVAQMLLDLDILTTPIENEAAGVAARITGDQRGIEATQINRGNMATQLPFGIGNLVQAIGKQKAPGGIMEWMDIRKNLARTADVFTLTTADRYFGGIDENGRIKEFARTDKTGAADMLPESKVAGVGNIANNTLNAFMYDVKDTNDIRNRLASMTGQATGSAEYQTGMNNSAEVLTVREGLQHAVNETNPEIVLRRYDESAGARDTLYKTAEALGMQVKDVLSLYSETPDVFEQRVRDAAAKNNGMFAGIDVSQGVDPISTIIKGFTTAKDGKGTPLAWDIRQVQYEITTNLIDSMAQYYTDYYGVKPNSTINTVFDTMKSAQSLLLLGWSPSYFINNVINNAVTSAAEGVLGFMTPKQIRQWMDAFGVAPARMDVDVNAEFRGQSADGKTGLETFTSAASDAKKNDAKGVNAVLKDINGVLRKANDKLGVFSTLSGKMETLQGNQLTAVAIQQYWGQRWKRGQGFHLMPDALVQTIEAQTPGMTNVIYTAIENGMNMDQIGKTLFNTYVKPDAGTVMKSVCEDMFRGEANVYEEILEKSGVTAEIRERIENCTTEEERADVIHDVQEKVEKYIDNLKREDLIQRANDVAAVAESEGPAQVSQIMSEMEMNHQDFWIRQRQEWTNAYKTIQEQNYDSAQSRSLLADLVARQQKEWADLYKQEAATAAGVMKGLGFQNESNARYITLMNEKNQNWQEFNAAKSRELQRAYDRTSALYAAAEGKGKGKNKRGKVDRVQINEVWEEFYQNVAELYDQHFTRESELQSRMDQAFVDGYEFATQKSGDQLRQNFQRIREIRQQMHDMQTDAHNQTKNMTREEQAAFYAEFNPKYNALIREIGNLGDANSRIIDNAQDTGRTYENHAPVNMTPEQTVQAEQVMEVNNVQREEAMRQRQGYLDRESYRQEWIDSGRTPAEADLYMAIVDAAANTWAKDNGAYPDEWYSQAAQIKGVASWLPIGQTTVDLHDGTGRVYQVSTVRPADINTENFRNWFGNGYFTDANGQPMIVFHGTAEAFDTFRKQKANDKLGRSMGLGLGKDKFYLTTERVAGEAFSRSAESLGRGKNPQVMELYVSIQNPIMQSEYEGRLQQKYLQYDHSDPRQDGYDYRQRDKAIAALDKEIRAEGYDGIYDPESGQIAVYDPTQIKSIYNGGDWSPNDPNILHQTAEEYAAKYHDIIMQHFGNPAFREWFGDSKVVDEDGMPLVVHHGTTAQFEVFSKERLGSNTGAESAHLGFFFSETPETAESYTIDTRSPFMKWADVQIDESETAKSIKNTSDAEFLQFMEDYKVKYEEAERIYGDIDSQFDFQGILGEYEEYKEIAKGEPAGALDWNINWLKTEAAARYDGIVKAIEHQGETPTPRVLDVYLSMQNPFVYDYKNANDNYKGYTEIIQEAIDAEHDGVIIKNTYDGAGLDNLYIVFEPEQIKSIENDGTFNKLDPNILHQEAQEIVKGTFEHTDVGNIIRMLEASDVSTMVHEGAHLFRRTLSQPLMQEFTKWAGFKDVAEFQDLERRFWKNDPTLTEAEKARYNDAEEKFARGFEQYLIDGSAPTPALKAVFKSFRDYLLDIYRNIKVHVAGNDYSNQGEFVFHGSKGDEVLNINATINGVKLRDIFDRMLTDEIQRNPGYKTLVQEMKARLAQDRHNMRVSDKALNRRAQIDVTKQILSHFKSWDEAVTTLAGMKDPIEIDGMKVDDATLFEALHAAQEDPQMNPFSTAQYHEVKGSRTYGYSIKYSGEGKKYQLQYKVVELNDLMPSNQWFGDKLVINEDYPADLQARNRQADQTDVYAHAANLNPGLLIDEQRAIDSGAPIVGEGNMVVESGNGRVLSLLYAKEKFPEQWQNYQEYLRNSVGDYGIDPQQLDSFENPVLIRERLGDDAVTFAEDANSNRNKTMSASENALTDANKMNMQTLSNLDIQPGEGVDTFTTEKNAMPAVEWLRSLPDTERNKYSTTNAAGDLILTVEGKDRFVNALFATLYATPESLPIIESFTETANSNIQAVESALKGTLPEMARAEGLIRSGSRAADLSITADLMAAAGLLNDARKASLNIHDYLAQSVIPGMERWTPTQALLAGFLGDAKNNVRMIKDFLNAYGEEVYRAGDPNQLSLFSDAKTREQMINDSLAAALNRRAKDVLNPEGPEAAAPEAGGTPRLNQSVMDSDGKWSSEFAKVLDENMQRTFDDGMSIPLDQAEAVFLRGDVDTKYETTVQRWLRDFSNNKNLSSDQYLYAWDYLEWWVRGSNGEAPKGNPVWENNIQKMVMNDFVNEHPEAIQELKRRNRAGAEVDNTAVPNKGEYFKRVYGFEHGFWNIAGNVYKDGKLVAYLPEEISKMKKTIEVDGQTYQVLGIDRNNPEGLVYYDPQLEIVRTVIAGKPEGFDEPRNAFAFMRPAKQGATPQTMPVADAYGELADKYIFPALRRFGEEYTKADTDAKTKQMSGLDLQTRAEIMKWLDQDVAEDMRTEKYRAMKYSDMKKDAAMLNYNQRYGFDPILMMLSPYQFWYTRSMWKWAKRMIDKPALGNAYERMKEYEDKNRQENVPSRVAGRWRIPMPFLPDWMGGSYYVDLNAQLYPFAQFGESYSSNMNYATLNARTEAILNEQADAGLITAQQMEEALTSRKGSLWENAYAQAETEIGKQDKINTLASQFISPNIFISWALKKQAGQDPGTLSGTRTGNAIKALTGDIPLVSSLGGAIGDAMTLPERALRKLYGFDYNEFGALGDQQIRKQISQMVADGEIDWRKGLRAMNEKSGTIWDMAADRQRQEAMMKVPTFAGAQAVKEMVKGNASLGDALGAMAVSTLGGGMIVPSGERTLREQKASKDEAYLRKAAGDPNAVNEWYDQNPEYVARSATYMNDPEELLKYTLYQNISTTYYNQPYAQQVEIQKQLGPEFYNAFINKETKNYKAVPTEKLAEWCSRIGGNTPNVGSVDVEGVERVMQLSQPVINAVEEHDEIMNQRFPGIKVIQDGYYALPKDQRKAYVQQFPQLAEYWDWSREYKAQHPEYERWNTERSEMYNEQMLYNSFGDMSERTQKELDYARATGRQPEGAARYELQRLYGKYANQSFMTFDQYVKALQGWK